MIQENVIEEIDPFADLTLEKAKREILKLQTSIKYLSNNHRKNELLKCLFTVARRAQFMIDESRNYGIQIKDFESLCEAVDKLDKLERELSDYDLQLLKELGLHK